MLKKKITSIAVLFLSCVFCLNAQQQKPDPAEVAERESARLETLLGLEDWQVFYVDSTLINDYSGMMAEIEKLQKARVENSDLYLAVQDKWVETTQESYKRIFTEEQWEKYLRQGGGSRIIKDREKRRAKREGKK